MKDSRAALAAFVKNIRAAAELDQCAFAKRLGVTGPHISKLEGGAALPSPELLLLIVREFGADAKKARRIYDAIDAEKAESRWSAAAQRLGVDAS